MNHDDAIVSIIAGVFGIMICHHGLIQKRGLLIDIFAGAVGVAGAVGIIAGVFHL